MIVQIYVDEEVIEISDRTNADLTTIRDLIENQEGIIEIKIFWPGEELPADNIWVDVTSS